MKIHSKVIAAISIFTGFVLGGAAWVSERSRQKLPHSEDDLSPGQVAMRQDEVPQKPSEAFVESAAPDFKATWMAAHGAGIEKTEKYEEATDNLITELAIGSEILRLSSEGGRLGDKRLRYKYALKSVSGPLLLGNSSTRHRKELVIFSLIAPEGKHFPELEVACYIPYMSKSVGFAFYRDQTELSSIGLLIPDFTIPANESPHSEEWSMNVRIYKDGTFQSDLGREQIMRLAKKMNPGEIVQLHPDGSHPDTQDPHVLWFSIGKNGSFTLTSP
ncbi:MAG: hypothetical protein V4675_21530 [Verrucomicrobiota bacterium]